MKKLLLALLACATFVSAAEKMVIGYYPYWAQYSQFYPKDVRMGLLTQIHYGYLVPSANGELAMADESDKANFEELVRLAKEKKVDVLVSIGGAGNEEAMASVATAEGARALAENALAFVREYKLAGIEIDWKMTDASRMEQFNLLVKALTTAFAEAKEEPLVAATVDAGLADSYSSEVLGELDYLIVGSLDQMSDAESAVKPNCNGAKLMETVASLAKKGIDAESLVPVLPGYGKSFSGATGLGSAHQGIGSGNEGLLSYRDLMEKFEGPAYKVEFDEETWSEVAVSDKETIVFNGIPSVDAVAKDVKANGYGGIALYDVSNDMRQPIVSLLVTAGKVLRPKVDYKKTK